MPTAMSRTPITHAFADDGRIPNNPTLPLVLYRGGIDLTGSPDPGQEIEIVPGDVVILPAGTGHQCLAQTPTLVVIGAYPPSGKYNLCRASKAERVKALVSIPKVPPPAADPVFGAKGPLIALWRT